LLTTTRLVLRFLRYCTPSSCPSIRPKVDDIRKLGAFHFVAMNGDCAKKLAFELDFIDITRDVAEGFPLEYIRWVQPYFILMPYTNIALML
jgi:hypothetical protein